MGLTLEEELTRPIQKFREQLSYAEPNAAFGAFVNGELVGPRGGLAEPAAFVAAQGESLGRVRVAALPRRGIARALMERAVEHAHVNGARRINLTVFVPNPPPSGSTNRGVSSTSAPSRRRSGSAAAITTAIS